MGESEPRDAWVFHAGALGDFVLIWPLLRALGRCYPFVHVVADSEKAKLAAASIGAPVVAHNSQERRFTRLWAGAEVQGSIQVDAALVVNFVADDAAPASAAWRHGAAAMFPTARIASVGSAGSETRRRAWAEFGVGEWGGVNARINPIGMIVCHVGAGSNAKRWPIEQWGELADRPPDRAPMCFIAGEVEAERFSRAERAAFEALGGKACATLDELARMISAARLFVGADTGPTHLAAQLGVPTLALFGPTDPAIWAPVGPRVRVLRPPEPRGMNWLAAAEVGDQLQHLLNEPAPAINPP